MKKPVFTILFLLLSFFLAGQINEGLVAKYYFNDGSLNDEMGNVNGVPYNTFFTTDRFGNPEAALGFDMIMQSNVSLGDNFDDLFALPDTSFSFAFWFKTTDTSNTNVLMISKYGNVNCWEDQRELFIRINASKRVEMVYYSELGFTRYRCVEGDTEIEDTLWHHAVVNYNGALDGNDGLDRVGIYVDNVAQVTSLIAGEGELGDIPDGSAHLSLGAPLGSSGNICSIRFLDGALDDMRFYDRLLDADDVDALFNEPNPFSEISDPSESNLAIYVYPNPGPSPITFKYSLEEPSAVHLAIFSSTGRLVDQLLASQSKGMQQLTWTNEGLPPGMYFYHLTAGERSAKGKMVLK